MFLRLGLLISIVVLNGCGKGNDSIDSVSNMFNHDAITVDQFGQLVKIPDRAESKKKEAFNDFSDRSKVADYLLKDALKDNPQVIRSLVEAKSRIVMDAYFDNFLKDAVTDQLVENYFSENKGAFSEATYVLSYYLMRLDATKDEESALEKANELFELLSKGNESEVDLKRFNVTKSKERLELDSENAAFNILAAIQELAVGDYSLPVRTKRGIQIFKVEEKEIQQVELKDVFSKIKYKLTQELKRNEYARLIEISR